MKKLSLYEISIILFFLVLPIVAVIIEFSLSGKEVFALSLKWFVFSAVGLRLFSAGIKQLVAPSFTLKEIFKIEDSSAKILVREIGSSNLCIGAIAIGSAFFPLFRLAAATVGAGYFLLSGLLHLFKKKATKEEWFAMFSDFFAFMVVVILMIIAKLI